MRALVTGGAGYIGGFLIKALLAKGHQVRVLDTFHDAEKEKRFRKTFSGNVEAFHADITVKSSPSTLKKYFNGVDWVFHLAGKSGKIASLEYPELFHLVNVDGTVHILEAARAAGAKKFLYGASTSCYGDVRDDVVDEDRPMRPMYPYALTKYVAEQYALHWGRVYNIPVISLRLAVVYGPKSPVRESYGYITGLIQQWKDGVIPPQKDQLRNLVYVTDVTEAFVLAAESTCCQEAFTVYGDTVRLGDVISALDGKKIQYTNQKHIASKIKTVLGWRRTVSFAEGMSRVRESIV